MLKKTLIEYEVIVNAATVEIVEPKDILLSELKTGEPKFFKDDQQFCDLYMISRVHINKTDFILTPLWFNKEGNYTSLEAENAPARVDIKVPMNHNVFRTWLSSPLAEYADGYTVEESPNALNAEHVFLFSLDSNYIHSPEAKYTIEVLNF